MAARSRFENLEDEEQEEILREAGEEFAEKGYRRASLNQIIERAGISKGQLYYYFEDKEDVFSTVLEKALDETMSYMSGIAVEELDADNFWDEIGRLFRRAAEFMSSHQWYVRLGRTFYQMRDNRPEPVRDSQLFEMARGWAERTIERGQELGVVRQDAPVEYLAEMCMAVVEAGDRWFLDHFEDWDEEDFEREAERTLDMFRRMLEPERTS